MIEESSLTMQTVDGVIVAVVNVSELTSGDTDAVLARLRESVGSGQCPKVVLDLTKVKFVDSVALGALVVMLRRVKQNDGRLALAGLSGHTLKVMQVTGLERVFEMHPNVPAAIAEFNKPA
jgi:anti-anti-sigma factor